MNKLPKIYSISQLY